MNYISVDTVTFAQSTKWGLPIIERNAHAPYTEESVDARTPLVPLKELLRV